MRTFKQFQNCRTEMTARQFSKKYGADIILTKKNVFDYNGRYIEIIDKGYYQLLLFNSIQYSRSLRFLEEQLWDEYVKYEFLSSEEIRTDLKTRFEEWAKLESIPIEEVELDNLNIQQERQLNYYITKFQEIA